MNGAEAAEIVVVGSLNLDLSVRVERFPSAGETVAGSGVTWGGGGKGANQAVAAARLGRRVAMIGAVGDDDAGRRLVGDLAESGVDVTAVRADPKHPTGTAVIEVDASGENRIVVVAGANGAVDDSALATAASVLSHAKVILTQFETPVLLVPRLAEMAPTAQLVVNPAPAVDGAATAALLSAVDYLIPNRHELAALDNGREARSEADMDAQVNRVLARGHRLKAVLVTLGSDGVAVYSRSGKSHVPAVEVTAVDTTAAGDAFCAGFADGLLAHGGDIEAATAWAVRVAAVAVTRPGAQASLPSRDEVARL